MARRPAQLHLQLIPEAAWLIALGIVAGLAGSSPCHLMVALFGVHSWDVPTPQSHPSRNLSPARQLHPGPPRHRQPLKPCADKWRNRHVSLAPCSQASHLLGRDKYNATDERWPSTRAGPAKPIRWPAAGCTARRAGNSAMTRLKEKHESSLPRGKRLAGLSFRVVSYTKSGFMHRHSHAHARMCIISIFAFVDATLIKPLPYKDPSRLVRPRAEYGGFNPLLTSRTTTSTG